MEKKQKVLIVIPVFNEEKDLLECIQRLKKVLEIIDTVTWQIVIADNASNDNTPDIARLISKDDTRLIYLRLEQKGRGRAIKKAWTQFPSDIYVYMDVDLSTDLKHLPALIKAIDKYDIAIGSRLHLGSKVVGRSLKREIISRTYNILIGLMFLTHFSDAQCGFKAVNDNIVKNLLPKIIDNDWFFDSELLIVGEKSGYKIYEEPVFWVDNPGSTVRVLKTITGDLRGLLRLFISRPWNKE
ncbi:MAG: glycosyltransferase [Candidatus Gottesmanbacteria bacterium]